MFSKNVFICLINLIKSLTPIAVVNRIEEPNRWEHQCMLLDNFTSTCHLQENVIQFRL